MQEKKMTKKYPEKRNASNSESKLESIHTGYIEK